MPSRGSGIGASAVGGLGTGLVGSSMTSTRPSAPGSVYGPPAAGGSKIAVHQMLWVLVLLEIAALLALRHAFRHYHGG